MSRFLVFALLSAALGCHSPVSNDFPIGIYGVKDPKHLSRLQQDGFDVVQTYETDAVLLSQFAAEARRLGMRLLIYPDKVLGNPLFQARDWPVAAWYLKDEPDVTDTPVIELEASAAAVAKADPGSSRAFVIGQGSAAKKYGHVGDVLMLDWYPIPHRPLDSVADQIDLARSLVPASKALWMVLQAFDWKAYPQRDPAKPRIGRFPDHAEMRLMSYLSILHGASGLFYFTLKRPDGQTLFDAPELWQAVTRVSREVKDFRPILERGRRVQLPMPPDPDGPEAGAWRYRGRTYVVILNRRKDDYLRVPDELLQPYWRPLFEVRRDARSLLKHVQNAWYLHPHQVLVFEGPFSLGPVNE